MVLQSFWQSANFRQIQNRMAAGGGGFGGKNLELHELGLGQGLIMG